MSNDTARERMLELLADRAMVGLSEAEASELKDLGGQFPDLADDRSFEKAAAAYSLSTLGATEEMPGSLRSRLEADAFEFMAEKRSALAKTRDAENRAPVVTVGFEKSGFSRALPASFSLLMCGRPVLNLLRTSPRCRHRSRQRNPPRPRRFACSWRLQMTLSEPSGLRQPRTGRLEARWSGATTSNPDI